jgi:hypothetical protein
LSNRKFISFFLSIFLFGLSKGQNTFNNYYQSGILSASTRIQSLNANTFLLTSYYKDSSNNQQGLDLKQLDLSGNVIKRKRYLFKDIDFLSYLNNNTQCDVSSSSSILNGGSSKDTLSIVIYSSINKSTLDTNWVRYFSDGIYNYHLNNTFKTKVNEVWFMGERGNNYGYGVKPVAMKIDTLGNLLSIKEFTVLNNYATLSVYYDVTDNLLYFGCTDYTNQQWTINHIVCMDTIGNLVWNKSLSGPIQICQIEKRNNYLVMSGFKITAIIGNNNYYKMYLAKANCLNNGNLLWEKTYGHQTLINSLYAFTINTDESITCAGTFKYSNYYALDHDGIILKANSNGDSLWARTFSNYGMNIQECFYDIKPTSDGGYIMCGLPFYAPNSQSWVVKTDSMGIAPGATYTSIKENESSDSYFKLWPNPANDYFFIKNNSTRTIRRIEVINEIGQIVISEKIPENGRKLNIENLPSGIYTVKLTEKEGSFETQKLVIVK